MTGVKLKPLHTPKALLCAFSGTFAQYLQLHPDQNAAEWTEVVKHHAVRSPEDLGDVRAHCEIFLQWINSARITCAPPVPQVLDLYFMWHVGSELESPLFQNSVFVFLCQTWEMHLTQSPDTFFAVPRLSLLQTALSMGTPGLRFYHFLLEVVAFYGPECECWGETFRAGGDVALDLGSAYHFLSEEERKMAPWAEEKRHKYILARGFDFDVEEEFEDVQEGESQGELPTMPSGMENIDPSIL